MRSLAMLCGTVLLSQSCFAWSEGGHHLIGAVTSKMMSLGQEQAFVNVLKAHPRFEKDFKIPADIEFPNTWLIGRASCWPDIARSQKENHRSSWHDQLGATLVIGDVPNVPKNPGPCPPYATLQTNELHIAQAIELCRRILRDKSQPPADRAIALCWICHLVGDAHQPCHSGSLYCPIFPEGDSGANLIPTKQSKNLRSLWDGLLGPKFDEDDVRRRQNEIEESYDKEFHAILRIANTMDPLTWLAESQEAAKADVYTDEVLTPINRAIKDRSPLMQIDLSEQYLKRAANVARVRAYYAATRLFKILREDLREE